MYILDILKYIKNSHTTNNTNSNSNGNKPFFIKLHHLKKTF